jgi:SAM-dependent methyltransferase
MKPKGVMDLSYGVARKDYAPINYRYHVRAQVVAGAAMQHLNPQGPLSVLDLGSADGSTVLEMSRFLPSLSSYLGMEYSRDLAFLSTSNSPGINMIVSDISYLPLSGRRFDLITAMAVLEHLSDPFDTIRNAARLLKKGGLFIATMPNPFWDQLSTRLSLLEDHHEAHLNRKQIIEKFVRAGLEILEFKRFMLAPIGFLPYLRIPVPPKLSLTIDHYAGRIRILDWLFVNQLVVARYID